MTNALAVAVAVLFVLVLGLAALVFALMRQVGLLHERIAPAGALTGAEAPRPGDPAPIVEVVDEAGEALRVGGRDPGGRPTLLLFVSPDCPVCKSVLPWVRSLRDAEAPDTRVVVASDGAAADHDAFARESARRLGHYVLSEPLGRAFQVGRVPHAVLLDAEGTVQARGLVNTREHLESLFEARARGTASIQEHLRQTEPGPAQRGQTERGQETRARERSA